MTEPMSDQRRTEIDAVFNEDSGQSRSVGWWIRGESPRPLRTQKQQRKREAMGDKIRVSIILEYEADLAAYGVETIIEAAALDQRQFRSGDLDLSDLSEWADTVSVEFTAAPRTEL